MAGPLSLRWRALGLLLLLEMPAGWVQASPSSEYADRAAELEGKRDARAWLALADFAEGRLLWKEREAALRQALALAPGNAEAHARLDEVKAGKEWLPADEAEAREAGEKQAKGLVLYGGGWIRPKEADRLREADRDAAGWAVDFRLDTPHLRIYSARPLAFTRRLAAILESEIGIYQGLYSGAFRLDPEPLLFRVYVFADRDTFGRVVARDGGPPVDALTPGIYGSGTRILYVGVPAGDSEAMGVTTAAHEMLHALDDLAAHLFRKCPLWVEEGRAHHLGYGVRGRRILPGQAAVSGKDGILQELSAAVDGADLRDLMGPDHEAFTLRQYAIAWAWIHFLLHGKEGGHAPRFRTYLQGLPGKASVADFEKAVGKLSDLEPEFKRYVKEALIPAAESSRP